MSANVDSMFSVREVPWHGLGLILDDYPGSWAEARKLAGLEWEPIEEAVYELSGMDAEGRPTFEVIPDHKQIKHSGTGKRLDIAEDSYEIIGHEVMGEVIEAILEQGAGAIRYETAGSLEEGRKVWALAKIGEPVELPGDPSPIQRYAALMNSHDGSAALRVVGTTVRVVCANTWHAAEMQAAKTGTAYAFKHTKNWKNRVEDAKAAILATNEHLDAVLMRAEELLAVKVDAAMEKEYVRGFALRRAVKNTVGKTPFTKAKLEERMAQPRVEASVNATVEGLSLILNSQTCEGIRGTAYGLMQAAGEFMDHHREARNPESYFTRTVIDCDPLKTTAYVMARELANA